MGSALEGDEDIEKFVEEISEFKYGTNSEDLISREYFKKEVRDYFNLLKEGCESGFENIRNEVIEFGEKYKYIEQRKPTEKLEELVKNTELHFILYFGWRNTDPKTQELIRQALKISEEEGPWPTIMRWDYLGK
ncbi:MAG: hypothetical protein B6U88_01760 [Candidatus Aenigmarchaeota archaeon ex4484_56]|nr:MAG: hypothetical protein B6U88_01760 [Candidatus Aenigmarchaeota archaeon ex4484_56]